MNDLKKKEDYLLKIVARVVSWLKQDDVVTDDEISDLVMGELIGYESEYSGESKIFGVNDEEVVTSQKIKEYTIEDKRAGKEFTVRKSWYCNNGFVDHTEIDWEAVDNNDQSYIDQLDDIDKDLLDDFISELN